MAIIIRRIFPSVCECTHCKVRDRHQDVSGGRSGYVRTKRCRACKRTFRVCPIAEEVDDGGAWTKVRTL